MKHTDQPPRRALLRSAILLIPLALILVLAAGTPFCGPVLAQDGDVPPPPGPESNAAAGGPSAEDDPAAEVPDNGASDESNSGTEEEPVEEDAAGDEEDEGINYLTLFLRGGKLMWPIYLMSLVVVTFGIERLLALRRSQVLPAELVSGLGSLVAKGGFDPRSAYKLCQQFPSAAANVIKAMLLKVGRPHTEVEHAVSEANDREAARLYANVRWLSLGAGVAPLMGLLGTVWGMIMAFYQTANLPPGASKAEFLADGIYVALVTTFAGLSVAIPAAVLAHLFEGRIQRLFRELDETLMGLMPQIERFEGRLRVSKEQMDVPVAEPAEKPLQTPAAAPK